MTKQIINEHEFYLDGILKENLDEVKKMIKKDWDYVFVIEQFN